MTDKQIIIDGVDITKCEFCDYENYEYPMCEQKRKRNELNIRCELRQNCYYKNWQHKEQECEELKKERDSWEYQWEKRCEIGEYLSEQLDQLKAKNKELTTKYNDCHCVVTNYHICFEGALGAIQELVKSEKAKEQVEYYTNIALNYLSMRYDERKKVPNKYKQTLTEIKKIAENAIKEMYVTKSDDYTDGYRWLGSIILQKISEVEND